MIGGRQFVLMLLPAIVAVAVVLVRRPWIDPAFRVRGLWAVAVSFVLAVVRFRLLPDDLAATRGVGVGHGIATLACVGWFVSRNWASTRGRTVSRAGILLTAVGAGLNALPVAVRGAMPVLRSSARVAGFSPEELAAASDQYVVVPGGGDPITWLGDVLPVPDAYVVLSLGDLLLFVGLAVLAGLVLASRLSTKEPTEAAPNGAVPIPTHQGDVP